MRVVILNGAAGAGKDTFVQFCRETLGPARVCELSTISMVKAAMAVMGWDGEKTAAARRMMSDIKDAWTRFDDGPFNDIVDRVAALQGLSITAVFVHVREPEEIRKFADYYASGGVTVLVRRPGIEEMDNHADQGVENYPYNVVVDNSGDLARLRRSAQVFCRRLFEKPEPPAEKVDPGYFNEV